MVAVLHSAATGSQESNDKLGCGDEILPRSNALTPALTAIKVRLELQSIEFRWLSGVEAKGTPVSGQFASTPLSERLTEWR